MNSEEKKKRDSRLLSFVPVSRPGKNMDHADMEKFARQTAQGFKSYCRSLRQVKPDVEIVKGYFQQHVRGSVTLCGCHTFKEYCTKMLGRSEQAVYAMLNNYFAKAKEKKEKEKRIEKPKPPADVMDSPQNREAAVLALSAVARFRTAKTEEERTFAWAEYERIADDGLQSVIGDDDRPHYMMMLLDLVVVTERLVAAFKAINPALADDEPTLAAARSCAEQAEKYCGAVRRRLNRPAGHAPMQLPPGTELEGERRGA